MLEDAPDGTHPVLPADLLALFSGVGPTGVGNTPLVYAAALRRHLGRNFGLEAEALLLDGDIPNDLTPEYLRAVTSSMVRASS